MSDYGSSVDEGSNDNEVERTGDREPFHYDYYLSNSMQVFDNWKLTASLCLPLPAPAKNVTYLQREFAEVRRIEKFKTADLIRAKAFVHVLKQSFVEVAEEFGKLFEGKQWLAGKEAALARRAEEGRVLQQRLRVLLGYLQVVMDQSLHECYQKEESEQTFEQGVFDLISKVYTLVVEPKLLWDISGAELMLVGGANHHAISLGGNASYYKNIMRSMLKRSWQLKEVYEGLLGELQSETLATFGSSRFLVKMVSEVWSLSVAQRLSEKEKRQFIDCMKGLYFLSVDLRSKSIFYDYLLASFHLQVLTTQRMFKDYHELQALYINVLRGSRNDPALLDLVYTLEMDKLSFERRNRVPEIENEVLAITLDYVGVAKGVLGEEGVFPEVKALKLEEGFASSRYLLQNRNFNGLVGLLMAIQQNSRDAFAQGDIGVHKVYLRMSEVLKEIYLSYHRPNWLFPADILLYIPLRYFMDISEDIKADVKKTLFLMVEAINQDRMPYKVGHGEDGLKRERVEQAEYLQVILYFLEECRSEEEYINLPEIVPFNLETSILYIKSLQLKLNEKEPTPEQMPYVVGMLKNCENYKLNIRFRWYEAKESIEDREIEFNIEKGLPEDWMRRIYRETINGRERQQIKSHFDKYRNNKGLTVLNLASIFKYCHALNPGKEIPENSIREEDLFTLLEEIKMLMSIHFDIFSLNLDEEISLSYIHVCLGFYNSCLKETPYNEAYMLIMEKVMKPYIRTPNSSLSRFKSTYPGFFQKWIYSFQIAGIFEELGSYISEKGEEQSCRQDIINKIKLVRVLISNKEEICKNIKIEELTELIVMFATLISRQAHPLVYIESVQLFCLFLNTFPEVRKEASLDFMLDASVLQDRALVTAILGYIGGEEKGSKKQEVSMLNTLITKLPEYQQNLGLRMVNDILKLYVGRHEKQLDQNLLRMMEELFALPEGRCSYLVNVVRFLLLLKHQCEQERDNNESVDVLPRMKVIKGSLELLGQEGRVRKEKEEGLCLSELLFIEEVIAKIGRKEVEKNREGNILARNIFHQLIEDYDSNDDRIFFAERLDFYDLIVSQGKELKPKEEALLIDLIMENKQKGNATELIKKLLRENRKLSEISEKVIGLLSKQKEKIHSHHINKFIHINNRYPKDRIEEFLLENIGCERNIAAVKINQQYLVKDLVRKLDKIPKNVCEQLLLKPIRPEDREKLTDSISDIFDKLLYLPIKKFENVNLKAVEEIHEENEDWNTESEGEEEETKEEKKKGKDGESEKMASEKGSKSQYKSNQSELDEEGVDLQVADQPDIQHSDASEESSMDNEYEKPQFLQIFTDEGRRKQLDLYAAIMVVRQELDVRIDSQYNLLVGGSKLLQEKEVLQKVVRLVQLLNHMELQVANQIVVKFPEELYEVLRTYGLKAEITQEMNLKQAKRKEIVKKPPKWMVQLFSDRSESDDSNIVENNEEDDSWNSDEDDVDEDDSEQQGMRHDYNSDSDEEMPMQRQVRQGKSKKKKNKFAEDELQQLPSLLPSHSKVQGEISGAELRSEQILKILEISIYWLLHLPESQIKSKHVTSFYMEVLQSNLGQVFFESFMTVIRFEETKNNLEWFVRGLGEVEGKGQVGLKEISMENAINNILYFIKEYENENQKKAECGNILFKESGQLLPIAREMITKFDLPIQNNCLTLLMIYIETNKAKIRNKISELDYELVGTELAENKSEYRLKYSEMVRIIEKICKHGSNNKIWDVIQEKMGLRLKSISKLFSCIKGYGSHLYKKLSETGEKIVKTIKGAEREYHIHYEQHQKLHNLENTYHILSKLVLSCKEEIKQFYYINKSNIKKLMEEDGIEIYQQMEEVPKVPSKMLQNKEKIFKSRQLMRLVEAMMYFIKMLKDQFYGKVEDKMFSKLIHYPKLIIEAVWYYIFIFAKHQDYKWTTPKEVESFFQQHPFIGSYSFANLQETFNLIVYFLNLQSFCTPKFKQFFLPVLMKNPSLAKEITLMFKVPKSGEDDGLNPQNILVTRKCSFDMAFYQVNGDSLQVQFFGQEGSDHGGLVRELMIGWKGRGVGEQAFFIGKILGISFNQGVPYGGALDIGMFVAITNYPITIEFFEEVDPQMYRSLKYIRDNDPEPLGLRFVVEHNINGKLAEYELIEGGAGIDLVEANKQKYLETYMAKYYFLGRERELKELKHGFNTVVYPPYAEIFTPFEMLKQIRGQQIVDVKLLIGKAKYEGYSADSQIIRWFWSIVESFDQEKMNTFIQFVTGSPKITVFNSNFSITIEKVYEIQNLPVAHTCFNTIDLPEYSTKEILEKKLLTAIFEGNNSFGIL